LQAISEPTAPLSRQFRPLSLPIAPHDKNFEKNATKMTQKVQPQIEPSDRRPRLVFSPDRTKYCRPATRVSECRSSEELSETYDRQEQGSDEVLNLLGQWRTDLVRDDQPSDEASKNCVYPDPISDPG